MNLPEVRKTYGKRSTQASAIARQLGFAGLGLVWILRTGQGGLEAIPGGLLLPSTLLVLALGLDLLQAVVGTAIWGGYQRYLELCGIPEQREFRSPRWLNWPALTCFWGKLLTLSWAYVLLISFMWRAVVHP